MKYNDPILPRPPIFAYMISLIASERNRTVRRRGGVTSPLPSLAYRHRHNQISSGLTRRLRCHSPVFPGRHVTPLPVGHSGIHDSQNQAGFEPEPIIPILDKRAESDCTHGRCSRTRTAIKGFGDPYADHYTKHPCVRFPVSDEPIYTR